MMFACEIGSFLGTVVALIHLALNVTIALACLVVFALVAKEAGLMLRLAFVMLPIGALVNIADVLARECRDVPAGEFAMTGGIAMLALWLVAFHRARLRQYRRESALLG